MKLTSPFLSPSLLPILFPSPFSSQWALTLADTVARRPRAEWSPTRASCPWPSPLTTPSPERDSLPTTPSARGPSPQDTKTRVSSWISERSARCGGQSCHLVHFFDISGLVENENRVNMSQCVASTQPSCPWARAVAPPALQKPDSIRCLTSGLCVGGKTSRMRIYPSGANSMQKRK